MSISELEEIIVDFSQKGYISDAEKSLIFEKGQSLRIPDEIIQSFMKLRLEIGQTNIPEMGRHPRSDAE